MRSYPNSWPARPSLVGAVVLLALAVALAPWREIAAQDSYDEPIRLLPLQPEQIINQGQEPDRAAPPVSEAPPAEQAPLADEPDVEGSELSSGSELRSDGEVSPGSELSSGGEVSSGGELSSGDVTVGALGDIDADAIGLLPEQQGGLPFTLWRETRRSVVTALLPRLPVEAPSPAMRSLALRLLLSPGEPPEGDGERGELLRLRAQMLAGMGEYDVAIELLRAVSGAKSKAMLARLESDRYFRDLDYDAACAHVRSNIVRYTDAHWQRALIFCQSLAEQHEAASLGMDLLRESGNAPEPAFVSLINAVNGYGEPSLDSLPNPSPLILAMMRRAKASPPGNVVEAASPAVLRVIASTPEAPIEERLMAAERSEMTGALSPATLRELYASVEFSANERANPISASESMSGVKSRALYFQAVATEEVPAARAELLRAALRAADADGHFPTMARATLPMIRDLAADPDLAWSALEAGRALFAAGLWDEASRWYQLVQQNRSFDPDAADAAVKAWPLASLVNGQAPDDVARFDAWWEALGGTGDPEAYRRAGVLLTLFEALGDNVAPESWERLLAGPMVEPAMIASPALRHGLTDAAGNRRIGETVLLALLSLGEGGPGSVSLPTLSAVVSALMSVGMETDARAIALEAALAHGL